ncbi:hypothetical protein pb186bvf_005415 [Paramecium bursaria]
MKPQAFKIVLVGNDFFYPQGDPKVGKSNLMQRYVEGTFSDQHQVTIGVEFSKKEITVAEEHYSLQIWDTCGEEKFRALTRAYYQGAAAAILVYDITDQQSFQNLYKWMEDIDNNAAGAIMLLVGNKVDLAENRVVEKSVAAKFANDKNLPYIETSAKDGRNVEQAFSMLSQGTIINNEELIKIYKAQSKKNDDTLPARKVSNIKVQNEKKSGCC